jgi:DNA-3-methyladenine glycosylase
VGATRPDRSWFERAPLEVAADLLGALLQTDRGAGPVVLRITEVEAYAGTEDPASHAAKGPSRRNASMYLPGGHLYVYRHLGLHHCVNVVTGAPGVPGAVLIRAGEVVDGVDVARGRRVAAGVVRHDVDLASGPARLVVALGLLATDDGRDLVAPTGEDAALGAVADLALVPSAQRLGFRSGPRVGVAGPGRDADRFPWRLWLPDEPSVSVDRGPARPRPSGRWEHVTPRHRSTAD